MPGCLLLPLFAAEVQRSTFVANMYCIKLALAVYHEWRERNLIWRTQRPFATCYSDYICCNRVAISLCLSDAATSVSVYPGLFWHCPRASFCEKTSHLSDDSDSYDLHKEKTTVKWKAFQLFGWTQLWTVKLSRCGPETICPDSSQEGKKYLHWALKFQVIACILFHNKRGLHCARKFALRWTCRTRQAVCSECHSSGFSEKWQSEGKMRKRLRQLSPVQGARELCAPKNATHCKKSTGAGAHNFMFTLLYPALLCLSMLSICSQRKSPVVWNKSMDNILVINWTQEISEDNVLWNHHTATERTHFRCTFCKKLLVRLVW